MRLWKIALGLVGGFVFLVVLGFIIGPEESGRESKTTSETTTTSQIDREKGAARVRARRQRRRAAAHAHAQQAQAATNRRRRARAHERHARRAAAGREQRAEEERRRRREEQQPPPQDCSPSYDPCLKPDAGDYDCEGGGGDGPNFTGPVTVKDSEDPFDLDRDGDGRGCDS